MWLFYEDKSNITWTQKLQWAIQILRSLMHVHAEGLVMGEVNYAQFRLRLNGDIVITGTKKKRLPHRLGNTQTSKDEELHEGF